LPSTSIKKELQAEYQLDISFPPKKRFTPFTGTLTFDVVDSFPNKLEQLILATDFPTKRARFRITFPASRPCLSASATAKMGAGESPLEGLVRTDDGKDVTLDIKNLRVGGQHVVYWQW
jgi:hypothetical protein